MIVAVEENLHSIRQGLQGIGYKTVALGNGEKADAIVYYRDGQNYSKEEMPSNSFTNSLGRDSGTLLVNAYGKSILEIDEILKNRSYSPLFPRLE